MSDTGRYYIGDEDELSGLTREEVEDVTLEHYWQVEDAVENMLNDVYPDVTIGHATFTAGEILRKLAQVDFRCTVADLAVDVDLLDYPSESEGSDEQD